MKYIYSYLPQKKIDSIDVLFDVICIKLSSTILKKNNKKVGIYSNNEFINLLKYYNVELDFYIDIEEEIGHMFDHDFFALPKIYVSSIQTSPFILLDIDMVLFDSFNFVFEWVRKYEEICDSQFLILVEHQFNGHLHLSRTKETIGVKHLIYNMLKYYDDKYIEWFELHKHNTLDFQQNIY